MARIASSCVTASSTAASSISTSCATIAASRSTGRSRTASACGKPQQIARRQRALNDAAAARRLERGRQRHGQRLVELHLDARGVAILHVDRELHPAAADSPLHARADAPFGLGQRLRHAKLQVEMAMVDRPDGHRDGGGLRLSASPTQIPSCS